MPHLHMTASAVALAKRAGLRKRRPKTLTKSPERARMEAALGTLRTHGRAYIAGLSEEELKKGKAAGRKAKIKRKKKKKKTATELLAEYVKRTGKPKVK